MNVRVIVTGVWGVGGMCGEREKVIGLANLDLAISACKMFSE